MDITVEYQIITQFFQMDQPCPSEIKNCQSLRNNYIQSNNALKNQHGCYPCNHNNLRTNTIQIIKKNLIIEKPENVV
jgi:hypothetical protein